jgi:hypothetical protein
MIRKADRVVAPIPAAGIPVETAAPVPAAANTLAKRRAQRFSTSSATAQGRKRSNSSGVLSGGLSALSRSSSATLR